jgi:hypothetical protein
MQLRRPHALDMFEARRLFSAQAISPVPIGF